MKRYLAEKIKFYDDCYAARQDGIIYAADVLEIMELNSGRTGPEALYSSILDALKAGYIIGRQAAAQGPKNKR